MYRHGDRKSTYPGCRSLPAAVGRCDPGAARRRSVSVHAGSPSGFGRADRPPSPRCVRLRARSAAEGGVLARGRVDVWAGGRVVAPEWRGAVGDAAGGVNVIDVTVPSRAGRISRKGIRIHRSGRLTAEEVTDKDGIPVTTVARTLLDLADVIDLQAQRRAVTEAEYRHLYDHTALIAVVESNPGRRTKKLLTAAMEGRMHRTRSPLEDRFVRFIGPVRRRGPRVQRARGGLRGRLPVAPGRPRGRARRPRRPMGREQAVRRDRKKDRVLWRAGIRTMRLTGDALDAEEELLADLVQAGVRAASWPRASSYSPPSRPRISSARAM